jgi:hypothetical protein
MITAYTMMVEVELENVFKVCLRVKFDRMWKQRRRIKKTTNISGAYVIKWLVYIHQQRKLG